MSGRGIIAGEEDRKCQLCGQMKECRPYGPHGEDVCFECGMKDEEAARQRFRAHVLGIKGEA